MRGMRLSRPLNGRLDEAEAANMDRNKARLAYIVAECRWMERGCRGKAHAGDIDYIRSSGSQSEPSLRKGLFMTLDFKRHTAVPSPKRHTYIRRGAAHPQGLNSNSRARLTSPDHEHEYLVTAWFDMRPEDLARH